MCLFIKRVFRVLNVSSESTPVSLGREKYVHPLDPLDLSHNSLALSECRNQTNKFKQNTHLPSRISLQRMPVCHCAVAGCGAQGGRSVDLRTLKNHTSTDQTNRYQRAYEAYKRAVNDEEERIATYFASLALSDDSKSFESPSLSGNRMWHREVVPSRNNLNSFSERSTAHQLTNSERVLQRLNEIDAAVDVVRKDMTQLLAVIDDNGSTAKPSASIKGLLAKLKQLDDDLQRVVIKNLKKSTITDFRQSIGDKLSDAHVTLCTTLEGHKAVKQARRNESVNPTNLPTYQSGTIFSSLRSIILILQLADHFFRPILPNVDPVLQISYFLAVACYVVFHIGRRGCNFILSTVSYIAHVSALPGGISNHLSQHDQKMLSDFVSDVRIPADHFNIEGKYTIYAICPNSECHRSHKPTFLPDNPIPQYPSRCNHSHFPGEVCDEILLRVKKVGSHTISIPIKSFVYFNFKDWLANLLSCPGLEERMDKAWKNRIQDNEQEMCDIFDGSILQNFMGADGKRFGANTTVGQYVFSLNVDFFNPNGNKAAGKSYSCGIVAMVCLNLPPDLRYQPENMYLAGIIPGRAEPPTTCINNYICPLVDDLLDFWSPGVHFSRTYGFRRGRTVFCALAAVVCDLPASRKVAGFASHSHKFFCSLCYCTREKDSEGCGRTDYDSWRRRGNTDSREYAERWRNAPNANTASAVFDESGLRWSELLRLPYFDPSRFVVLDAMHNLFLGLLHFHFCDLLGYRAPVKQKAAEPTISLNLSDEWKEYEEGEQKSFKKILRYLESPMANELETNRELWHSRFMTCHVRSLSFVCKDLKLISPSVEGTKLLKKDYVNILINWV